MPTPPATVAMTKPMRRTSGSTPSRGAEPRADAAEQRALTAAAQRRGRGLGLRHGHQRDVLTRRGRFPPARRPAGCPRRAASTAGSAYAGLRSIAPVWSSSSSPPRTIRITPLTSDPGSKPARFTPAPRRRPGSCPAALRRRSSRPRPRPSCRAGRRRARAPTPTSMSRCSSLVPGGRSRGSSTSRSTPPSSPPPDVDRAERDVGVGRHAHVARDRDLDLAGAELERQRGAAGRELEVAQVDRHGTDAHLIATGQLCCARGPKRPLAPRAAEVEVARRDRGQRQGEHDGRRDEPAGAAAERAAHQADAAGDDQAGDDDPAAHALADRGGGEAADRQGEQHDADADLRGDRGRGRRLVVADGADQEVQQRAGREQEHQLRTPHPVGEEDGQGGERQQAGADGAGDAPAQRRRVRVVARQEDEEAR